MKLILPFIFTIIACLSVGCNDYAYEKNLKSPYYLNAFDDYEEMSIGVYYDSTGGTGVIPATVFAVAQNDDFIIAKQHPFNTGNIDKLTTNYFIIPLNKKISKAIEKNYFGPLSLDEYNTKRHELGIRATPFTIVFKELE